MGTALVLTHNLNFRSREIGGKPSNTGTPSHQPRKWLSPIHRAYYNVYL